MKTSDLSIKELEAFIGVSTDTIRRAVATGRFRRQGLGPALRFDLHEFRTYMERNAEVKSETRSTRSPGGTAGRAQVDSPRLVTRGHYPQGSLQEV